MPWEHLSLCLVAVFMDVSSFDHRRFVRRHARVNLRYRYTFENWKSDKFALNLPIVKLWNWTRSCSETIQTRLAWIVIDVHDCEVFDLILPMVPFHERIIPVSAQKIAHPNWIERSCCDEFLMNQSETGGLELDAMMLAKEKIPPDDFALVVSTSHPDFCKQVHEMFHISNTILRFVLLL